MLRTLEELKDSLVEMGVTRIAHLDGDLLSHLEETRRILERLKCPEHVQLAGLFHGIYGTQALGSADVFELSPAKRERVREIIGDSSERLVYNFCAMTYNSFGKSVRNVLRPDGRPELRDRLTGSFLDVTRDDFVDLLWVKFADILAHIPNPPTERALTMVIEHGGFWQMVAEFLSADAVNEWNRVLGEFAPIKVGTNTDA